MKESLLLPNENNGVKNSRPRRASEPLIPVNIKLQIMHRSSSLPNIEDIRPKSLNPDNIVNICTSEIEDTHAKDNTPKFVKKNKPTSVKKPVAKFELLNEEYWVDKIPRDQRRMVPRKMPPVRNLFFTKYTLREEKWYETELRNINELLASESNMTFYALPMHVQQIERSFNTNHYIFYQKEIEMYNQFFNLVESLIGTSSQYFFIVNRSKDMSAQSNYVWGIGKIESIQRQHNRIYLYITYYSLSNIGEYSIKYTARSTYSLDLHSSKLLVQKIKLSLECGKSIPVFEKHYVSILNLPCNGFHAMVSMQMVSMQMVSMQVVSMQVVSM